MRISHDTLLEYAHKMVNDNDRLKQIICDQYPVIFVDEFQDTSPLVVKTIACVNRYANKIGHPFIAGYYGDVRQNIYVEGIGSRLFRLHTGLVRIKKIYNRRSSPQIIHASNLIRSDGLKQRSIYTKFPKSQLLYRVYLITERDQIVEELCHNWAISKDNPLHCFELTNELVAKKSGFESIYNSFKNSKYYKQGQNFELLRAHVLSHDVTKLSDVSRTLFSLIDFRKMIEDDGTALNELLRKDLLKSETRNGLNVNNIRSMTQKLRSISGDTLKEYVQQLFEKYGIGDILYDDCVRCAVAEEINSLHRLEMYIYEQLIDKGEGISLPDEELEAAKVSIQAFLNIDMGVFYRWYDFIIESYKENEIIYHTFHSTKGHEYDQVLVFMTSKFGRRNHYFSDLLNALAVSAPATNDSDIVRSARNLFYIAVTRAVRNLCVVYLVEDGEDAASFEDTMKSIFGCTN